MNLITPRVVDITHWHIFCGIGGGADGFNRSDPRAGHLRGRMVCLGGIDVDKGAIADFTARVGVPGTVRDLFTREQYIAFHEKAPPADWREATTADIHRSAQHRRPNIVFGSAPCKGFSGLLPEKSAATARYQALNQLAIRGLRLALEAWKDDPPEFWLWENVPRIQSRGAAVLDEMRELLESFGYATNPTTHDCGELGELAQHRDRFLLVCRHKEKVPPFLYEPPKRRVKSVGEVLGAFPLPDDPSAGPMHAMRKLKFKTWKRLAFVRAGSDWRSLKDLVVVDGFLRDYALQPVTRWHNGALGVARWDQPAGTVTSTGRPHNGVFSVADPRVPNGARNGPLGVNDWTEPSQVIAGESFPTNGRFAVADPRPTYTGEYKQLGVKPWDKPADTVTSQSAPGGGAHSVADPRPENWDEGRGSLGVNEWSGTAPTIIGVRAPGQGKYSVADPRLPNGDRPRFSNVFRVVRWDQTSTAVVGGQAGRGGPEGEGHHGPRVHAGDAREGACDSEAQCRGTSREKDREEVNRPADNHRLYLATALAAEICAREEWPLFLEQLHQPWSLTVEGITEIADRVYQRWLSAGIQWGETHDQYLTLERLADLYFVSSGQVSDALVRSALVAIDDRCDDEHHERQRDIHDGPFRNS